MLRPHWLDGALLFFDRESGDNVLLSGPSLSAARRRAPRVVHWGLSSGCDLRCSFCFRDRELRQSWAADEVIGWASELADAGVMEIAFGQGEPLLFRGFAALVRGLHERTPLSVCFTTNGTRLTPALLDELAGAYGQLRLSFHDDNEPLARARMLAQKGARFGVNLLVTPARLASLRSTVEALVDAGCRDVLLLSYNGPDAALHLSRGDDRALARDVLGLHARHGDALSIKLSVCFGERLSEVPQLRPFGGDCGAGDEFFALDSARRLLACSFHGPGVEVSSAAEALAVYRRGRSDRAPAPKAGCARAPLLARRRLALAGRAPAAEARPASAPGAEEAGAQAGARALAWRGWASNHSTAYTLVGEFPSEAKAAGYIEELSRVLALGRPEAAAARGSRPLSVWQATGRDDEPPSYEWEQSVEALAGWGPRVMFAGGRRVLVHSSSTLGRLTVCALLLLRRHGRILWHLTDAPPGARLVFGLDAGEHAAEAARRLTWSHGEVQRVDSLVYGWVSLANAREVVERLALVPPIFALASESEETLAEALEAPAPVPRKRRVEWLYLGDWSSYQPLRKALAPLWATPVEEAARAGVTAPFRMPRRWSEQLLPRGTLVRVDDGPIAGALQQYLLWRCSRWLQVVEGERLRVRVRAPRGAGQRPDLRGLSGAEVAGMAEPGWRLDEGDVRWNLDLVPRDPMALFAQLRARYPGDHGVRIELLPPRPLAAAIAKIQHDLARLARGVRAPGRRS